MKGITHIQKGEVVNATWKNMIAISYNGTDWSTIMNHSIKSIGFHSLNLNSTSQNNYPERFKESGYVIDIKLNDEASTTFQLNVERVENQATWIVSDKLTNVQKAVEDLNSWMAIA